MDVQFIKAEEASKIIKTREPQRLFIFIERGKVVGIDNRTGEAWTEEFDCIVDCIDWLLDPEKEKESAEIAKQKSKLIQAIFLIMDEHSKAVTGHPAKRNSAHEALAYIMEEYKELEQEVFLKKQDKERMKTEAAHIAVTAIRFIQDICWEE